MIERIQKGEIVVIDDFFSPEMCKHFTNSKTFHRGPDQNYQGRASSLTAEEKIELRTKLEALLKIEIDPQFISRARVANKSDKNTEKSFIHYDPFPLVGIIYLSNTSEDPNRFGTHFYEYKNNGKKKADYQVEVETWKWSLILENHSKDLSLWNKWNSIDYKFGRLVLFDGGYFHSGPLEVFGEDDQSGRYTVEFFANFRKVF